VDAQGIAQLLYIGSWSSVRRASAHFLGDRRLALRRVNKKAYKEAVRMRHLANFVGLLVTALLLASVHSHLVSAEVAARMQTEDSTGSTMTVTLVNSEGKAIDGLLRLATLPVWPLAMECSLSLPAGTCQQTTWHSSGETLQGQVVQFRYADHYSNWDYVDLRIEVTTEDGRTYLYMNDEVRLILECESTIALDATAFGAAEDIESVSWEVSHPWDVRGNAPEEFPHGFPISGTSGLRVALESLLPDVITLRCEIILRSGASIAREGEILVYARGGSSFSIRSVAAGLFDPLSRAQMEQVMEPMFPLLKRIGFNSIGTHIREWYDWPVETASGPVFSIHPIHEYSMSRRDPRGSTPTQAILNQYFDAAAEAGFTVNVHLAQAPYRNDSALRQAYDHSGYGSESGFAQTDGYLYSDEGLGAFLLRQLDQLSGYANLGVVWLTTEMGQPMEQGGAVMREFFNQMFDAYRAAGVPVSVSATYQPSVGKPGNSGGMRKWGILLQPGVCGIPFANADYVSFTYYPSNASSPGATMRSMFETSQAHVRNLRDASDIYGKPVFIQDMYCFNTSECSIYPLQGYEGHPFELEEPCKWLAAHLSAMHEANLNQDALLIEGISLQEYGVFPDEWLIAREPESGIKKAYINEVYGRELLHKVLAVFLWTG